MSERPTKPGLYHYREPGQKWRFALVGQLDYQRKPRVWFVEMPHGQDCAQYGTRHTGLGVPLRLCRGEFRGPIEPPGE